MGANLERPGLRAFLSAIEVGRIDYVVVYKVDRLSRSLLDFARLMSLFERLLGLPGVCCRAAQLRMLCISLTSDST